MISAIFRGTVWSQTIPEAMRGRLAGIEMLSYSIGPLAGQVRAGVTADLWSVRGAISSGGFACVAGVSLTALWLRDFWDYDARTDEHAVAERAVREAAGERLSKADQAAVRARRGRVGSWRSRGARVQRRDGADPRPGAGRARRPER